MSWAWPPTAIRTGSFPWGVGWEQALRRRVMRKKAGLKAGLPAGLPAPQESDLQTKRFTEFLRQRGGPLSLSIDAHDGEFSARRRAALRAHVENKGERGTAHALHAHGNRHRIVVAQGHLEIALDADARESHLLLGVGVAAVQSSEELGLGGIEMTQKGRVKDPPARVGIAEAHTGLKNEGLSGHLVIRYNVGQTLHAPLRQVHGRARQRLPDRYTGFGQVAHRSDAPRPSRGAQHSGFYLGVRGLTARRLRSAAGAHQDTAGPVRNPPQSGGE